MRNSLGLVSYYQSAEGFPAHISEILQKIRVLLLKRENVFYMGENRELTDLEIRRYCRQILFTMRNAEFNKIEIFAAWWSKAAAAMWHEREAYHRLENIDRLLSFLLKQRSGERAKRALICHARSSSNEA